MCSCRCKTWWLHRPRTARLVQAAVSKSTVPRPRTVRADPSRSSSLPLPPSPAPGCLAVASLPAPHVVPRRQHAQQQSMPAAAHSAHRAKQPPHTKPLARESSVALPQPGQSSRASIRTTRSRRLWCGQTLPQTIRQRSKPSQMADLSTLHGWLDLQRMTPPVILITGPAGGRYGGR